MPLTRDLNAMFEVRVGRYRGFREGLIEEGVECFSPESVHY